MTRRPIDPLTGEPRARLTPGRKPLGARLAPLDLTPELRAAVEAAAEAAGVPVAEWLRRAAAAYLAARVETPILPEP